MAENPDYEALLADLEQDLNTLVQLIDYIRRKKLASLDRPDLAQSASATPSAKARTLDGPLGDIPRTAFSGMSTPEAIRAFLRTANARQTVKQITEGISRGGFHTTAKNLYSNVYSTLMRQEKAGELARVGSEWGLAEWYSHVRREKAEEKD
jgi:hypothetical protein